MKLPNIENDEYTTYLSGIIDYLEVLRTIEISGNAWKMTDGKLVTFPGIVLTRECKAWYYFLGAWLMPVRHFSDITKERVVLLYAIVTEKSIDLGKCLSSHIIQCTKHSTMCPFYPSLITAICVANGVQYGPNEEFLAPMFAITNDKVQVMTGSDNRLGPIFQGSQPHQRPSSTTSPRNLTMAKRMERLEGKLHHKGEQF